MDPRQPDDAALQAAQRWAFDLPSASYVQRQEFIRWVNYSPEHLKAYFLITALETELTGVKQSTELDLGDALHRLSNTVATLPVPPQRPSPPERKTAFAPARGQLPWIAVAASIAVLALVFWTVRWHPANLNTIDREFTTDIGQRRSLILLDGTRLQLNTDSTVLLHYDASVRNLTLLKGEAWIRVAREPNRPFGVDVGSLTIKDIGTEFTVRAEPGETTVYVIEGRVQLNARSARATDSITTVRNRNDDTSTWQSTSTMELAQNQEAVIRQNGTRASLLESPHTLTPSQSQKRLAWTRGKLVLMGEPLRDVVREINRYHRQKLVIADPALEQTEVGGVIDPATYDYRVIIRALGSRCPIVFDDSDPAVLVLRRSQAPECEASR